MTSARSFNLRRLAWLMFALTVLGVAADAGAKAAPAPDWERWRRIELTVHDAFLFSGRFELVRDTRGELTRLETAASARFLGARLARSRSTSVLDESGGRTQSHVSLSKRSGRRYEFDAGGYDVTKLRSDRFDREPARWEAVHTTRHDLPAASPESAPDDGALLDVYSMLLHLRFRGLDAVGDRTSVRVASKRGPVVYEVFVVERRRGTRRVRLGAASRRVRIELDELRLRVRPADPTQADAAFLNMEGETEIWVEAGSKAPIEIRGRIPRVGRVSLLLDRLDAPPVRD